MQHWRQASVAIPFYRDDEGELRLVLIQKSASGLHGGQIALPGGNREPADDGPWSTVLREIEEELGLGSEHITLLAELPAIETLSTGYQVSPYVVSLQGIASSFVWNPRTREVERVLDVSVRELASDTAAGEEKRYFPGWSSPRSVPVRRAGQITIWGLTLRLLDPLLPQALAGHWRIP